MTKLKVYRSRLARLRGLLGTAPNDDLVLLTPCSDVHTFGMSYSLDLAFIDSHGRVIKSYRNVEPGSRLRCAHAKGVVERAACAHKKWFAPHKFAGESIYKALEERKRYENLSRM